MEGWHGSALAISTVVFKPGAGDVSPDVTHLAQHALRFVSIGTQLTMRTMNRRKCEWRCGGPPFKSSASRLRATRHSPDTSGGYACRHQTEADGDLYTAFGARPGILKRDWSKMVLGKGLEGAQ